ncbi:AAA family ATPase [Chlorobium phaeovibrioides]|uniref:AAA family ATPase n=1 Tax=Chlorobium phaeovibrioides TaxID=1094 RepID=UPI0012303736|nr:AAA family ATPase [Chlorobium phaeovibrioides]QEQ57248.1 AAA family ATPase [Chlorobium phaeovibrioides]
MVLHIKCALNGRVRGYADAFSCRDWLDRFDINPLISGQTSRAMSSLSLFNIGQIKEAKVAFGDLTILVGDQATGKSLFLQMHKLTQDVGCIKDRLALYGYSYDDFKAFLSLYLGEGMENVWGGDSELLIGDKPYDLVGKWKSSRASAMKNFYIPAQRVMMMEYGFAKPFTSFDISYPYVLKDFSELIRFDLDKLYAKKGNIFPQPNKLRAELRDVVSRHIYRGGAIKIKLLGSKKQLVMEIDKHDYAVGSWSAGQKEFAPLLFGLYWALPGAKISRRDKVSSITIEEPEMGLHPNAVVDTMLLVLELLSRGYKVNLSTHSNTVLELFWAIGEIKKQQKKVDAESRFLDLFGLGKNAGLRDFAKTILTKRIRIYYFESDGDNKTTVRDISRLEVEGPDEEGREWGGINRFSSRVSSVVSSMYGEIHA